MHLKVVVAALTASALLLACEPDIPNETPPSYVTARFDPSQTPPVVPTPNDLAYNPKTGTLNVTPGADASPADLEFVAWLNTLNGFPASSSAGATFTGDLDDATVSADATPVLDASDGFKRVDGTSARITEPAATAGEDAKAAISVSPPSTGWTPGHTYAVAILGGDASGGLKGTGGKKVVGSATWALIRSEKSLVTCTDLTSPDCRSTTEVIPSTETDPAARQKDQAQKAVLLEQLRLKYKPAIDALIASGTKREDIALLWTFKVHEGPIAQFNPAASPPQVPIPTDLAIDQTTGLVNAPVDPNAPAAQQEFTTDYLNTLDGFPVTAAGEATVIGGELDAASVTPATVIVLDTTTGGPASTTIAYDATTGKISISPPATGWEKGHRYAVAMTTQVKTASGTPVAASDAWALARSSEPLVDCADLTSADCKSVMTMAPISTAQAVALEGLRRAYAPILDALAGMGVERVDVALLWTFKIVSFSEATFDPANSVIPFPNNLLLSQTNPQHVNIPIPSGASPLMQQLITGLNTLDGFSTTGPFVSENSDALGALDKGQVDPATVQAGTGFVALTPGATAPDVTACLNCASSLLPDGGTPESPQQLQFVTNVPLDEKSTYAAFLTDGLKDTGGKKVVAAPAFALIRMANPLVDGDGKSQVSGVSDANAQALEPVRQGMKPLMDALAAQGMERKKVALAWAFKTQSALSHLNMLYDAPTALGAAGVLPANPIFAADISAQALPLPGGLPSTHIGKVFAGEVRVPWLLNGQGTTLDPNNPSVRVAPFTLTVPAGTPPANGWPVTIFGHGLSSHRNTVVAIADSLAAQGRAAIAIDYAFHGDRSTCVGSAAVTGAGSDDGACANPATQKCDAATGRCVARNRAADAAACDSTTATADLVCTSQNQGRCLSDNQCEGGDFLRDASGAVRISGNGFLDLVNLFATRDHFRSPVADLAQVVRMLKSTSAGNLSQVVAAQGGGTLDGANLTYAGISLGGIVGTMFTAASPDVGNAVLNVPGADPGEILLTGPAFTAYRNAFLGTLASQGITQGTPGFDNFMAIAKWILGPADPQNAAYWVLNGSRAPASRKAFLQYIVGDMVVPNPTTERLIASANRSTGEQMAVKLYTPPSSLLPPDRHGFLLNFKDPATTMTAQTEAVNFLVTGTAP